MMLYVAEEFKFSQAKKRGIGGTERIYQWRSNAKQFTRGGVGLNIILDDKAPGDG